MEVIANILQAFDLEHNVIFLFLGLGLAIIIAFVLILFFGKKIEEEEKGDEIEEEVIDPEEEKKRMMSHVRTFGIEEDKAPSYYEMFANKVIPLSEEKAEEQGEILRKAGHKESPHVFWLNNVFMGIGAAILGAVAGLFLFPEDPKMPLLLALCGGGVVFILKKSTLSTAQQKRNEAIERQMPATLQLLSVITMSGSGLEQAFKYVAEHQDNEFAEEIRLCYQEMRYGASSQQALTNMAERNNIEALKMFCGAMIQGINQGMSISDILIQQSESMETRQRLYLEEQANKIPTKMMAPLMMFCMPSMFVIILAPAFVNLAGALGS